uniref:Uncharacterized protein n=1 Tax=Anguilla anguilla TaxID=7936 RepID=A0A0E9XDQ4_ANGAN
MVFRREQQLIPKIHVDANLCRDVQHIFHKIAHFSESSTDSCRLANVDGSSLALRYLCVQFFLATYLLSSLSAMIGGSDYFTFTSILPICAYLLGVA